MNEEPVINACWKTIGVYGDHLCPQLKRHTHCRNCEVFSAAAAALLDRKPPPGYREEWTARVAQPRQPKLSDAWSIVIFRIGEEWLALPTTAFVLAAEMRPIHSLPHRKDQLVKGLVNIRGNLLVCVSLAHLLGFEAIARAETQHSRAYERLLVVEHKGGQAVFPVHEVQVGCRYHPGQLQPVPATVALALAPRAPYSIGLLAWREHNVGVLDEQLLFHTLNNQLGSLR